MEPHAYGPYAYDAIIDRAPLTWPDGARIAFWVVPNIEAFPLDVLVPGGLDHVPDVSAWGRRDYGNRVGVFRMMAAMARHGVRGTVALNSDVCDVAPRIVEECLRLDWEIMGHGETNAQRLNEAGSEAEAEDLICRALDRIERAIGRRPRGWLGAGRLETWSTLDVLAREGCVYTADWDSDDQPVLMDVAGQPFVSLPYGAGVSDLQAFERHHFTAEGFERMITAAFDVLYRESETSGRIAAISLHPFIVGLPHRTDALDRALEYICGHDGVWCATGSEIVDYFLGQ